MTRTEKLECINKYRHYLYVRLRKYVPNLLEDPDGATNQDIALYNKLAYDITDVQRGDIIAFWSDEGNAFYAKRVIGLGGDTIEFHDGYVFINGLLADESLYLDENVETNCSKTFTVPEGCVFVLGDNRDESLDSRYFLNPYIPLEDIEGKYIGSIPKIW